MSSPDHEFHRHWIVILTVPVFFFLITIAIQLFKYPSPIKARVSERNKNILYCNHKKTHLFATEPRFPQLTRFAFCNPQGTSKKSSHARGEVPACRRRGGSATCGYCYAYLYRKRWYISLFHILILFLFLSFLLTEEQKDKRLLCTTLIKQKQHLCCNAP